MSDSNSSQEIQKSDFNIDSSIFSDTISGPIVSSIVSNTQDAIDLSKAKNEETLTLTQARIRLAIARTAENCAPDVIRYIFITLIITAGVILSVNDLKNEAGVVFATTGMTTLIGRGSSKND